MLANRAWRGRLRAIAVLWLLVGASREVLGFNPDCGPLPCSELRVGPAIEATLSQSSTTVDPLCEGPSGSDTWTAQQWADYFGVVAYGWDLDEQHVPYWDVTYTPEPPYYSCALEWYDWAACYGGPVVPVWSFVGDPPDLTKPGTYTLRATFTNTADTDPDRHCGVHWRVDSSVTRDFTATVRDGHACQVVKLQYWDEVADPQQWVDAPGTMYVWQSTSVTFRAISSRSDGSWPEGHPEWSGSAGASGTGPTKIVGFSTKSTSTTNYKTVVVTCANSMTWNVVVYSLDGVFTPEDNFTGRSLSRFGLAEVVYLSFTADPPITAAQAGGLKWKLLYGDGTVAGGTDGTGTFTAGATPGPITLKLRIESGPSAALGPWFSKDVVAPDDGQLKQKAGSTIWHVSGTASVGFEAYPYLRPKDVSFKNIEMSEGGCIGVGTGYWLSLNGLPHAVGSWQTVGSGNSVDGCRWNGTDTVQTGTFTATPFSAGTFSWAIPWRYRVGTGAAVNFTVATHYQTIDSAGTTTIEKKGAGPFSHTYP